MRQRIVIVKGLFIYIRYINKDGTPGTISKRKLVAPEFIELWYLIHDGKFDQQLWHRLSDRDRDFLALCVHQSHITNREFETALARSSSNLYERMKLLEAGIKAGDFSDAAATEFNQILDRLAESGQMTQLFATKMKKKLERTMQQLGA